MGALQAAFKTMNERMGDPKPDQSGDFLGLWPPHGEHECYITHVEIDEKAEFFLSMGADGQRNVLKSTSIRFWYQLVEDLDNPDNPLAWGGAPFQIPNELPDDLADNKISQLRMDRNRLCGHLKCITKQEVGGPNGLPEDAALDQVVALLAGAGETIAIVNAQYSKAKKQKPDDPPREFRKEFLKKLLAS